MQWGEPWLSLELGVWGWLWVRGMAIHSHPQIILMLTEKYHQQQEDRAEANQLRFLLRELEQKVLQLQKDKETLRWGPAPYGHTAQASDFLSLEGTRGFLSNRLRPGAGGGALWAKEQWQGPTPGSREVADSSGPTTRSQKIQLCQQLEHQHTEAQRLQHELAKEQKVRASLGMALAQATHFLHNVMQVNKTWVRVGVGWGESAKDRNCSEITGPVEKATPGPDAPLFPERLLASLAFSESAIQRSLQGLKETGWSPLRPWKALGLSLPIWRMGIPPQPGNTLKQALGLEFPRGGCWGHYGPDPGAHPTPTSICNQRKRTATTK